MLVRESPGRLAWVITIQAVAGLTQAVSVLLLIPLLAAVGVNASSNVGRWIHSVFVSVGVKPTLVVVIAIYVGVTAASAMLNAYQRVLSTRYRLEFIDQLRGRLYTAIARAEWRHLMGLRQSDVLTVLTSSVMWIDAAVLSALSVAVAAILICAQLAAAFRVSAAMTALAVLTGAALLFAVWPLIGRSRRLGAQIVEHDERMLGLATGFLDGLKLAKAFGHEQTHVNAFKDALEGSRGAQVEHARASGISTGVQATLTALLLGTTIYIGVRVLAVPVASLLVVAFVFNRLLAQLVDSQGHIQQLVRGLPSFDHVMRLITSCEAALETSRGQSRGRVEIGGGLLLDDVYFAYPSQHSEEMAALRGVSIELPRGSLVALAGPSGAGKTTVADLAAGLVTATRGCVRVGGVPLTADRLLAWRLSVALVPQDPFLFHDTIEANLRWARHDATETDLWDALGTASAAEFVKRAPGGLQAVVGDRGARLSGGERQRLALARALLRDPDLLILDEATSSLDTENELAIRSALSRLKGRTTILLIAHRLSTLQEADQIVVLDAGRVIEAGSWDELTQLHTGRFRALIAAGATRAPELAGW